MTAPTKNRIQSKLGVLLMICGALAVAAAAVLFWHNAAEARQAGTAAAEILPRMEEEISRRREEHAAEPAPAPAEELLPETAVPAEMPAAEIGGKAYIGCLTIPKIERQLPILADWDETLLKTSPCRYFGTLETGDLVIAGHNYRQHFGPISQLSPGDRMTFTDMNGVSTEYQVTETDILNGDAIEEMTSGISDLTLFTCNYSGEKRITVRCDKIPE